MSHSIHSEAAQPRSSGDDDAASRLAACVTSHFVVEKRKKRALSSSRQTVLTVCRSVTSQPERSLSWKIYTSINRHEKNTDVSTPIVSPTLSLSRRVATSRTLQRWKIIPGVGVSAATLPSLRFITRTDQTFDTAAD